MRVGAAHVRGGDRRARTWSRAPRRGWAERTLRGWPAPAGPPPRPAQHAQRGAVGVLRRRAARCTSTRRRGGPHLEHGLLAMLAHPGRKAWLGGLDGTGKVVGAALAAVHGPVLALAGGRAEELAPAARAPEKPGGGTAAGCAGRQAEVALSGHFGTRHSRVAVACRCENAPHSRLLRWSSISTQALRGCGRPPCSW